MAILEVENVVAGYVRGIDILNGVSMKIDEGGITGMIGPNGAGKSTMFKTIFGFLHPAKGRNIFDGQEIQSFSPDQIKKAGVSFIPQRASTFPMLTVAENLLLGAWIFRHDRRLVKERINEVYEQFPVLKKKRRSKATFLSGGELRMLAIAKEVVTSPRLLLVDEPSAGLAPNLVTQVYEFLRQVCDQGVTIFLVDQNIAKAVEVSDYMYLLEMGKIKAHGPTDQFRENIREIISDSLLGE